MMREIQEEHSELEQTLPVVRLLISNTMNTHSSALAYRVVRRSVLQHQHAVARCTRLPQHNLQRAFFSKRKKGKQNQSPDESDLEKFELQPFEEKMDHSVQRYIDDLKKYSSGRAHPVILEGVKVKAYGSICPLREVATISVKGSHQLAVAVADPELLSAVKTAISSAGRNLNPQANGNTLSVPIPKMTKENLNEQLRAVKADGHEAVLALRKTYNLAQKKLKRLKAAYPSQDEFRSLNSDIQTAFDLRQKQIDELIKKKNAELETK